MAWYSYFLFKRKYLLCAACALLLCFFAVATFAQGGRYTVRHYSTENGLPQNTVSDIAADKYGFVWLGTENGLVRFDGRGFRIFNLVNTPVLKPTDRIRFIAGDEQDNVFIGAASSSTYRVMGQGTIQPAGPLKADEYFITRNKGLATHNEIVALLRELGIKESTIDFFKNWSLYNRVYKINAEEFYIADDSLVYYLKKGKGLTGTVASPNSTIIHDTVFGLSTPHSIKVFYKDSQVPGQFSLSGDILADSLYKRRHPVTFLTSRDCLLAVVANNYYSIRRNGFELVTTLLFSNLIIRSYGGFYYDKLHDSYYFSTVSNGFYLVKPVAFVSVTEQLKNSSIYENAFSSQVLLDGDSLLLTRNILFDKAGKQQKSGRYWGTPGVPDGGGTFWYSMPGSMVQKMNSNLQPVLEIKTVEFGIELYTKDTVSGTVWCAREHAIYTINQQTKALDPLKIPLLEKERIWHISTHSAGHLWVGTDNGLYILNTVTTEMRKIQNSAGKIIRNVLNDPENGIAWVGTYGHGPCYVKNGEFFSLPLDKAQNLLYAHYFVKDNNGYLWMPTNNGLYQASVKDVLSYTANHNQPIYYQYYNTDDGFASNEFNGGYTAPWVRRLDGTISMCSMKGLVWFKPEQIKPVLPSAALYIDGLAINGKDTSILANLALPFNYNQLAVKVVTPYFGNPQNLIIEYQVDGLDTQWVAVPISHNIVLSRLQHGAYTLNVRALAGFGGNYQVVSFPFKVLPAWYESLPFYLLLGVLSITIVLLLVRIRLNRLLKRGKELEQQVASRTSSLQETVVNYETAIEELADAKQLLLEADKTKEEIIAIILHDLWSPLNFLSDTAGRLEQMKDKYTHEELLKFITAMSGSTRNVTQLTSELMTWLRTQKDGFALSINPIAVQDIFAGILKLYKEIAAQKNNQIIIECTENITAVTDAAILTLIIRNLIDNANKNTKNGFITLSAGIRENKHILISITDTGKGMADRVVDEILALKEQYALKSGSLGFRFVFDFAKLIHADIHIEKGRENGTAITIELAAHPSEMDNIKIGKE